MHSVQDTGWQNWSKSLPPSQAGVQVPADAAALADLVRRTNAVRPVGSGHSWTPLVPPGGAGDGAIVRLDAFDGIAEIDAEAGTAWLGAGGRLKDLSPRLAEHGLAFRNLGDIDVQSLAGATSTATHGTGKALPCLAAEICGVRMITGSGEMLTVDAEENSGLLPAVQVALGALGILTEIKMQLVPRYKLHRHMWSMPHDEVMAAAETMWAEHRNFEFFYIPFAGRSFCLTHDVTEAADVPQPPDESDAGVRQLKALRDWLHWCPPLRRFLLDKALAAFPEENAVGESWQLLSSERNIAFNEMEYHLPVETGLEAFEEVRTLIERERPDAFFPFECRMTAGDDAWLSPFNQGPRISVAVHCLAGDAYDYLFTRVEPVFRKHGGRPHWGKLNSLSGADAAALYPRHGEFAALCRELDPHGRFLNPYLAGLFGVAA